MLHKPRIGLCLLVWNELKGCQRDVPKLPRECFDEIFALDGGSSDGTAEFLQEHNITVIQQPQPGYNRAYISAFEHTSCDALVIFHPKGSIEPDSLRQMISPIQAGMQLVIASRNMKGGRNEEDCNFLKPRKWFVLALSALTALLWWRGGPVVWDVLHGYRAMTRESFFAMEPLPDGISMDLQMVARAYKLGLTRAEIPVVEAVRVDGSTHFKALPTGLKLLRYMAVELGREKPQPATKNKSISRAT